ncbi:MAG: hypothetical protein DHS20C16_10140 [Phycisphaerae bacterium]|nr:MAG: hypothetical protein DHS20C16_10140 [Phycisphaerae bacterium]
MGRKSSGHPSGMLVDEGDVSPDQFVADFLGAVPQVLLPQSLFDIRVCSSWCHRIPPQRVLNPGARHLCKTLADAKRAWIPKKIWLWSGKKRVGAKWT